MSTMVDLTIASRTLQVACREGEEDNLRAAARLVDSKSREALSGLARSANRANSCSRRCRRPAGR
jgi:cell division protein ZapA (FtsZ GTPase activity inhibitor)